MAAKQNAKALVGVIMGSDSDYPVMAEAGRMLEKFGIGFEVEVVSAHRSPARAAEYAETAARRGLKAIIVGAGGAAHLAGVVAALTTLPVIGVPMPSTSLNGMDSLLSTVQMPGGVSVATMAIGKPGATNAGIFAAQILALSDAEIARRLADYKKELDAGVAEKSARLKREIAEKK
ncbi:MAG TPA: 5-(carboxyamino)imidazole ribonucleotide mutase [Candidatus Acidoferrales bacterium]|nr:5-(carboxyamino)imidazole ribonucleotide mutase [Candidatus Acidoferrales bacterium]